jgi:hypothetical protein
MTLRNGNIRKIFVSRKTRALDPSQRQDLQNVRQQEEASPCPFAVAIFAEWSLAGTREPVALRNSNIRRMVASRNTRALDHSQGQHPQKILQQEHVSPRTFTAPISADCSPKEATEPLIFRRANIHRMFTSRNTPARDPSQCQHPGKICQQEQASSRPFAVATSAECSAQGIYEARCSSVPRSGPVQSAS